MPGRKGDEVVKDDETPFTVNVEKIPTLRPAFNKDGTGHGGHLVVDFRRRRGAGADDRSRKRRSAAPSRSRGSSAYASNAHEPEWFTTAPVGAIKKVLAKAGWKASDVDLFEVNEAFAVVTMAAMKDVGIPHDKVNVNGGACALGHPIGATGARIITTLIYALKKRGLKKGVAALCIGGGEGNRSRTGGPVNSTINVTPIENARRTSAPNLAAELRSVGIDSLEALMRVGFWDAWQQLRRANPERNCLPACLALAGAVAGVRWNHLPPKVRADIRQRVKAARA